MSLVRRVLEPVVAPALEQRALPPDDTLRTYESFFGSTTAAGPFVTYETAMFFSVVHACVRVKADAFASMPFVVYRRNRDGKSRERAPDTRAYFLLHEEPNPEMSAPETWSLTAGHFSIDGNAFIGKTFKDNQVAALWPIRPDRVRITRERGQLVFLVRGEDGVESVFTQREIIHVRDVGWDGLRGWSPIKLAAQQIGAGLAIEKFMDDFWKHGAIPSVILKTKGTLTDDAHGRLLRRFLRSYRSRRRGVVVLEDGVDFQPVSLTHVDAQFIEQKKELVESVARVFRVPLSKLMTAPSSGSSMTYRNLEQDNIVFHQDAVLPDAARFEHGFARHRDLFDPRERLFPEWLADAILRADSKTRAQVDAIALGNAPWLEVDEKRAREGMPPSERLQEKQLADPPPPAAAAAGDQSGR